MWGGICMKKKLAFVLGSILLLSSCGQAEEKRNLEFPNTEWDMSAEEVLKACGVTKEEADFYEESNRSIVFSLKKEEIFGETAEAVHFGFLNLELGTDKDIRSFDEEADGDEVLCAVAVVYPKDTDMETVQKEMEKQYGKYAISNMQEFSFYNALGEEKLSISEYEESDTLKLWGSETIEKAIGEKDVTLFQENGVYYMPNLDESQWEDFSKNGRLVTISMVKDGENPTVNFNAYNLAVYEEIESD